MGTLLLLLMQGLNRNDRQTQENWLWWLLHGRQLWCDLVFLVVLVFHWNKTRHVAILTRRVVVFVFVVVRGIHWMGLLLRR